MALLRIAGLCMALLLAPTAMADVFHDAQWIRDPRFKGVDTADLYHLERVKGPKLFGPQNVHSLFRKEVTLAAAPKSVLLAITGDDYYKFYINGRFVVQGPEAGYPFAHPYYWLDVTDFFTEGVNCLASHSYYQGLLNRVWNSADNRSGFLLGLDVTYADGTRERFVTDPSWRCFQLQAFPTGEAIGYATQFLENIDLRLIPEGWRQRGFDDGAWLEPLVGHQDHQFELQLTPPLQHTRKDPVETQDLGNGRYRYDFGTEVVGHTRVRIRGEAGAVITVRHGEELTEEGEVRYKMRAKCVYDERPMLSGRDDLIEFYDYRGFRYIEILDALSEPEVWVDVRHHPFDPAAAQLKSSNQLLENIWRLCQNGVQMGSQGGFLDCPTREKGPYLGDAVITGRSHLWLTADPSLTRKTLHDFALSRRICPGLMAVAPSSFMQEIADYSLQYPLVLEFFYQHSGDRAFLADTVDAVFDGLYGYFEKFENDAGLLEGISKETAKWVLVDWPDNLRDDYDYEYAKGKVNTVLNAFYYGALRTGAALLRELGRDGDAFDAKAERVAQGFAQYLADSATGLYVDAPGSKHSSLHANAVPLAFGLTAGADPIRMLDLIREKRLSCGVYIASYVIEACFRNGAADVGYDLLTSRDERSWHEMLRHGATTCMEAWGPEQKWNTSWCHPWSSSPIYLIAEYVMGLSPAEPGWEKIRVAPAKIAQLPDMELTVPIPHGRITACYQPGLGYTVTVPTGVPVEVLAPEGIPVSIHHAGSHAHAQLAPDDLACLQEQGWTDRVGNGLGVWVSVDQQRLYLIENMRALWQAPCATAKAGAGSAADSGQTPLGWHRVAQKFGDGALWGQEFRSRSATKTVWQPGDDLDEDLVLTRVLWLAGDEPGKNAGKNAEGINVDSKERCIYIHGTNDEARIGTPSSHGCIRLRNDDVIAAFERIPLDTPLLITKGRSDNT